MNSKGSRRNTTHTTSCRSTILRLQSCEGSAAEAIPLQKADARKIPRPRSCLDACVRGGRQRRNLTCPDFMARSWEVSLQVSSDTSKILQGQAQDLNGRVPFRRGECKGRRGLAFRLAEGRHRFRDSRNPNIRKLNPKLGTQAQKQLNSGNLSRLTSKPRSTSPPSEADLVPEVTNTIMLISLPYDSMTTCQHLYRVPVTCWSLQTGSQLKGTTMPQPRTADVKNRMNGTSH